MANPETHPVVPSPSSGPLLARRLLSLSAIVPLGVFLLVHLYVNGRIVSGEASFDQAVHAVDRLLIAPWLAWLLVAVPLAIHAVVGLWIVLARAPLPEPRPYPSGLRAALRATGVVALAFVAVHVWSIWAPSSGLGPGRGGSSGDGFQLAGRLAADLSSTWRGVPWRGVAYLVGTTCVTFHLAVGTWGFFAGTRGGRGALARKRAAWVAGAAGIVMAALFANIVVYYATGARLFGRAQSGAVTPAACPTPTP